MTKLETGALAPAIDLPTDTGNRFRLSDYHGKASVLLYFYPEADTPACTDQSIGYTAQAQAFADKNVIPVGISPDFPQKLAKFREKHGLTPILVSDPDHLAINAYGVWGEKKNYGRVYQGLIRSTFLIGPDGRIESTWYNTRAKGQVERVLKAIG